MPVVVIIEGIILLEHVTKLNLKLRFASNMYQICSMHVQVLSRIFTKVHLGLRRTLRWRERLQSRQECPVPAKGQLQPGSFYQAGSLALLVT